MDTHLIDFESLPWSEPQKGLRYKVFQNGNQRVRLAEFSEGFTEDGWCRSGHAGYVLDGECRVEFNGREERFCQGDALFIPEGETDKHRVTLDRGQKVLLLLFETV